MTPAPKEIQWKQSIVACLLFILLLPLAYQVLLLKNYGNIIDPAQSNFLLPNSFPLGFDSRVNTAADSKGMHQFWFSSYDAPGNIFSKGYSIDILQNSELFQEVFPGYPDKMRTDKLLWNQYFWNSFGSHVFLPSLENLSNKGYVLQTSMQGCLDIYKKYGADILIIGNSEVLSHFNVGTLSRSMNHARVLMCAAGGLAPIAVTKFLSLLNLEANGKIPLLIYGYSFFNAYVNSGPMKGHEGFHMQYLREKEKSIIEWKANQAVTPSIFKSAWLEFKSSSSPVLFLRKLLRNNWANLLPENLTFSKLVEAYTRVKSLRDPSNKETFVINGENDLLKLQESVTHQVPAGLQNLGGITEKDCEMNPAKSLLNNLLLESHRVSVKMLIYLSPATERVTSSVPACYPKELIKMLNSFRKNETAVSIGDLPTYGLTIMDYMHPNAFPEVYTFERSHLSFSGAQNFTKWIIGEIVEKKLY